MRLSNTVYMSFIWPRGSVRHLFVWFYLSLSPFFCNHAIMIFSIVPQYCPSHLGAFSRKRSLSETISFFEDIVSSVAVIFALQVKEPNYRIISFNDRVFFMNFTIDLITLLVHNASVVVQFWAPWFSYMNLYSPKNYVIGSERKISFS